MLHNIFFVISIKKLINMNFAAIAILYLHSYIIISLILSTLGRLSVFASLVVIFNRFRFKNDWFQIFTNWQTTYLKTMVKQFVNKRNIKSHYNTANRTLNSISTPHKRNLTPTSHNQHRKTRVTLRNITSLWAPF